jgi:4-diphosphocytidyl-2-C-methyl-D-erythritol kinase
VVLTSYAKLNLSLTILGKRSDSYHNLTTLFERIDLHDTIRLRTRADSVIRIITNSKEIPADSANLAWRAAELIKQACVVSSGVDITIAKCIPVAGGLAGGSSNAAMVLLGLNKLWRLGLSKRRLLGFARRLGADVAFFIHQVPFAQGQGRGDRITPLRRLRYARFWHVIVVPDFGVSTPLAYKKWDEMARLDAGNNRAKNVHLTGLTTPGTGVKLLTSALEKKDLSRIAAGLYNSLETVVFRLYPEIRQIKHAFRKAGAQAILMSGSGPAVFCIVPSRKEALTVRRNIGTCSKAWRTFVARTI